MGELNLKEICVGVLQGGVSEERDISLLSGEQVCLSLERQRINAKPIDIFTTDEKIIRKILEEAEIEIAFIALHGRFGEDGGIQSILEKMDLPYTGSKPLASYLAMNKIASKKIFKKMGVPTPEFLVIKRGDSLNKSFSFPQVVKPYFSGSSLGISIVYNKYQLNHALGKAFSLGENVILESYIEGREFTVGILEEKPLGVVEIVPQSSYFDFTTKYSDNLAEFLAPAPLDKGVYSRIQRIALEAHKALGCEHFSRVDIRLSRDNTPFVLEVNSIPGLTSHSLLPLSARCYGIDFDGLIKKMVVLALERGRIKVNQ
ncbi:MAG: D-alanine--D-alanine ligase [Candidatus Omnitrophota bacterium]|nr:MAG: D-alanine--D-alanine ligase [Candidatus Omnitrophota bacterium]HDN85855.1 D-alanine--D-alanine ligase [Candidatus Omnitrophota bacterium]